MTNDKLREALFCPFCGYGTAYAAPVEAEPVANELVRCPECGKQGVHPCVTYLDREFVTWRVTVPNIKEDGTTGEFYGGNRTEMEAIIADIYPSTDGVEWTPLYAAAHPAEQGRKPTPLLFDNEWLRAGIAKDSDDEPSAGGYPRCNAILYPDGHCPACEARTDAAEQGKDAEDAAVAVYIICPVRYAEPAVLARIERYAIALRDDGYAVHFPPSDAPQDDPTGKAICEAHKAAMLAADEVHVYWDVESKGSHFDLGMAYALGKKIVPIECLRPDGQEKSYWKVMQ